MNKLLNDEIINLFPLIIKVSTWSVRIFLLSFIIITICICTSFAQSFTHPGLLNNEKELNAIKAIINSNLNHPMKSGWKNLQNSNFASLTYKPTVYTKVTFDNGASESAIKNDAHRTYACALSWVVTGDIAYAKKAIEIMNNWSYNVVELTGSSHGQDFPAQACLEVSWYAPIFCAGAEIIRYYKNGAAGWTDGDIKKFEAFLSKCEDLSNHIVGMGGYSSFNPVSNWGTSAIFAKLSINVFKNNRTEYNASINKYFSKVIQAFKASGETNEVGRDPVHGQYAMVGMAMSAEIERHQGTTRIYDSIVKGSIDDKIPRMFLIYRHMNQILLGEVANSAKDNAYLTASSAQGQEIALNYYRSILKGSSENIRPIEKVTLRDRPKNDMYQQFPYFTYLTHADLESALHYKPTEISHHSHLTYRDNIAFNIVQNNGSLFAELSLPAQSFAEISFHQTNGKLTNKLSVAATNQGKSRINCNALHLKNGFYIVSVKAGSQRISNKVHIIH
jgi:hypothetical protein